MEAKKSMFCRWLLFLQSSMVILHCYVSCAEASDIGPYKQIYPRVDITQDQLACSVTENGSCPLYIALMVSFGGEFDSSGVIPGVQMALDQINADPTMLPGYTLHYTLRDTICETHGTVALDALHTQLFQPPTKVGVIGSGCSLATEPTAQISHYYNLTHLSCASSSTSLANRFRFRYYFQLLATEADLAIGFYSIISRFNWSRVAILLQEESLFEVTMNYLVELLRNSERNIDVKIDRFTSVGGISGLGDQPFDPNYRIFLYAMYSSHARRLLCEASKRGVQYPRNQFLFYGWYADQWWVGDENEQKLLQSLYDNNCSVAQREQVIGPAMSPLQDEFISNCSKTIDSGIDGFEFQRTYEGLFNKSKFSVLNLIEHGQSIYAQQCYDATWTLARALNQTINEIDGSATLRDSLKEYEADLDLPPNTDFGLQHFSYNNTGVVDLVFGNINSSHFSGITGDVFFNTSNGVRIIPKTVIFQYRPTNIPECSSCSCSKTPQNIKTIGREVVAEVDIADVNFELLFDEESLWPDGVPYDGVPVPIVVTVHILLTVICFLLAILGIAFAIFCMIFNFLNREKKYSVYVDFTIITSVDVEMKLIRLTSPNLNYLTGVGAIVLYVGVCIYVIPADSQITATVYCNLTPWLTAIGYSLCYGTIVAKMFRVFYIFRNPTSRKRKVHDWMLALSVVVFITIDVIILLTYTTVEGIRGNLYAELQPNDEDRQAEIGPTGIVHQFFFYVCDSKSRDIALGVLYGYKALLQIIALAFSFSIRKVKVKGLNDAKYIAAAVYVTSIVTTVIIVSLYSLKRFINLYAALFALGFFIGTTFILALVFLPKVINLYRDPEGTSVFSKSSPNLSHQSQQSNKEALKENERVIESLRNRVRELESSLPLDEKFECGGEDKNNDRKLSLTKVTFSEVNTLIIENGQSRTASSVGSLNNIAEEVKTGETLSG